MLWSYFVGPKLCMVLMENIMELYDYASFFFLKYQDVETWDLRVFRERLEVLMNSANWVGAFGRYCIGRWYALECFWSGFCDFYFLVVEDFEAMLNGMCMGALKGVTSTMLTTQWHVSRTQV